MIFEKGSTVNFNRNAVVKKDNATVVFNGQVAGNNVTIIEYDGGWTPEKVRIDSFGLDATKKYIFVVQDELSAID